MARRKDGIQTRDRILAVACEVFAEKGYHDATTEEICAKSKTNIAAINYHFGSKDQLYTLVWRSAFDEATLAYPPEGGLGPDAPAEDRLRGAIYSLVGKAVNPGSIGHAGKLLLREMINPTEVIDQVRHDAVGPLHERMTALMKELLGPKATHEQTLMCVMSIVHQCIVMGVKLFQGKIPPHLKIDLPCESLVEMLADHITRFSLAGIRAVREHIESDTSEPLM